MDYYYDTKSNLVLTADENDRQDFREYDNRDSDEAMLNSIPVDAWGFEWVDPAEIGALTSAPILSDGQDCFGFMDYQIDSVLGRLAETGEAVFEKG